MSVFSSLPAARVYEAASHESALSEVAGILCILQPRAIMLAGLSESGEVLLIHEDSYTAEEGPVWMHSFFEQHLLRDNLLGGPQRANAIAVASEETLLVPSQLMDKKANEVWLRKIHFLQRDDEVKNWYSEADDLFYYFSIPEHICKLLHQFLPKVPIIPIAAYQFYKPQQVHKNTAQCVLINGKAIASIRHQKKLVWHGSFSWSTAEDVAYHLSNICKKQDMKAVDIEIEMCTANEDYEILLAISCFFPQMKATRNNQPEEGHWAPTICLLQQLYACVL